MDGNIFEQLENFRQPAPSGLNAPGRNMEYLDYAGERIRRELEQKEKIRADFGVNLDPEVYDFLTAQIEDGTFEAAFGDGAEEELFRLVASWNFAKRYGLPVGHVRENLPLFVAGEGINPETRPSFGLVRSVVNKFKIGLTTPKIGKLGKQLMEAEERGYEEDAKWLWSEIDRIEERNRRLEDNIPDEARTNTDKLRRVLGEGAQTLGYSGYVFAHRVLGMAVGLGVMDFGHFFAWQAGADVEAATEYIALRRSGIDADIARPLSEAHGAISSLIEQSLEFVLEKASGGSVSIISGKTKGAVIGKLASRVFKGLQGSGFLYNLAKSMMNWGANIPQEYLEEFFQEGDGLIFEAIAKELQNARWDGLIAEIRGGRPDEELGGEELESIRGIQALQEGLTRKTAREALGQMHEAGITGGTAAIALGFGGTVLQTARSGIDVMRARETAKTTPSREAHRRETENLSVYAGLKPEDRAAAQDRVWERYHGRQDRDEAGLAGEFRELAGLNTDDEYGEGSGYEKTVAADPETGETVPRQLGGIYRRPDGRLYTKLEEGLYRGGDARVQSNKNLHFHIAFDTDDGGNLAVKEFHVRPDLDSAEYRREIWRQFSEEIAEAGLEFGDIQWTPSSEKAVDIRQDLIRANPRGEKAGLRYFAAEDAGNLKEAAYRGRVIDTLRQHFPKSGNTEHALMASFLEIQADMEGVSLEEHIGRNFGGLERMFTRDPNRRIDAAAREGKQVKGAVTFESGARDAKAVIYVTANSDLSTFIHETGHIIRRRLSGNLLAEAERVFGVKDGNWKGKTVNAEGGQTDYEEVFAEALERYMRDGYAPTREMKSLFEKIAEFLAKIYNAVSGREAVSPEIKEFFDGYFAGKRAEAEQAGGSAGIAQEGRGTAQAANDTAGASGGAHGASVARYEANKKFNEERPLLDKNNGRGDPKPKQPSNNLDEVYRLVEESREEFDRYAEELRQKYGGEIISRKELKSRERAERKITPENGAEEILDINGKTLVLDDLQSIVAVMRDLHGRGEVVRMKDRYKKPQESYYRDTLANIRMPNGAVVELQLNTKQMLAAKEELGGHLLYEIEDQVSAAYDKGLITDEDNEKINGYVYKGYEKLYEAAFNAVLASNQFSASSLDTASLLKPISTHFHESGTGTKVLSGKTLNKLQAFAASSLSSQSRNLSLGSSNDGTFATGTGDAALSTEAAEAETKSSFMDVPSTTSIAGKKDSVKSNSENISEKNSPENEERIAKARERYQNGKKIYGAKDQITLPNGETRECRHVIIEAGIMTASADSEKNLAQNERFPVNADGTSMNVGRDYTGGFAGEAVYKIAAGFDQRGDNIVGDENGLVISGNNRYTSAEVAARNGTDKKYLDYLKLRPERWGVAREDIARFEHPVHIMEIEAPRVYSPHVFDIFNRSGKKSVSPLETAIKMSYLVTQDTVNEFSAAMGNYDSINELYEDAGAVTDIFMSLMKKGIVTENSYPEYVETVTAGGKRQERVTSNGREFLESVMLGAALNKDAIRSLALVLEIRRRVVKALAALVDNAALGGYSVISEISRAVAIAVEVQTNRKTYKGIEDYASQKELDLGQDVATDIEIELAARLLEKTEYGFSDMMGGLNAVLREEARGQGDMFESVSRDGILRRYLGIKAKADGIRAANNRVIESGTAKGIEKVKAAVENAGLARGEADGTLFQTAYHGSPHRFDRFDSSHMGSGEGAQSEGWGLYFASKREVAEYYYNALSETAQELSELSDGEKERILALAEESGFTEWISGWLREEGREKTVELDDITEYIIETGETADIGGLFSILSGFAGSEEKTKELFKKHDLEYKTGQLYEVDIPGDKEMLDWDKPFSGQPEQVKKLLRSGEGNTLSVILGNLTEDVPPGESTEYTENPTGQTLYEVIAKERGSPKAASQYLNSLGIKGIRYLDGASRADGEGSYNYVIFDDSDINITQTFFQLDDELIEEAAGYDSWREFRDSIETAEASNADNAWYRSLWNDARKIYPPQTLFQGDDEKPGRAAELDRRFYKEADQKYLTEALKAIHGIYNDKPLEPESDTESAEYDGAESAEYERLRRLKNRIETELPKRMSVIGLAAQAHSSGKLFSGQYDRLKKYIRENTREFRSVFADVMGQEEFLEDLAETADGEPNAPLADPRPERIDLKERLAEIARDIDDPALAEAVKNGEAGPDDPRIVAYEKGQQAAHGKSAEKLKALETETGEDFARLANKGRRHIVELYDKVLAAKEKLAGANDRLIRMADEAERIGGYWQREKNLARADYDRALKAYNDYVAVQGIEADVREALARRDARAAERIAQTGIRRRMRALRALKETKAQIIKRAVRKYSFEHIAYDQCMKIKAVQRMLLPSVIEGGAAWIGNWEGPLLREVHYRWETDAEEYRPKLLDAAGEKAAGKISAILGKPWEFITNADKKALVKLLPRDNIMRDLALETLAAELEGEVQLDIKRREEAGGGVRLVPGAELERQLRETLGDELYVRILNRPIAGTPFNRAVWDAWNSYNRSFRNELIASVSEEKAAKIEAILNKPWGKITGAEKQPLANLLPNADFIWDLRERSRGWSLDEAAELARVIDRLAIEGRRELAARREAEREAARRYREKLIASVTKIEISDGDTPEEKIRKGEEQLDRLGKLAANPRKSRFWNNFFDADIRHFTQTLDGGRKGTLTDLLYWGENDAYNTRERNILAARLLIDKVMADNHIRLDELFKTVEIKGLEGSDLYARTNKGTKIPIDYLLYITRGVENEETYKAIVYGNLSNEYERKHYEKSGEDPGKTGEYFKKCMARLNKIQEFSKEFFAKEENKKFLALARAIGGYYDRNGERMNRASIELFNRPMWRVRGYLPMYRLDLTGAENEHRIVEDFMGLPGNKATQWVNRGRMEKRLNISPYHQAPVELGLFKTWEKAVRDTEHLIAYGPLVQRLNAVFRGYGSAEARKAVGDRWGKAAIDRIDDTISKFARPNPTALDGGQGLNSLVRNLRGRTATAYLAWKASSVLKQAVTSPWPYLQEIPPHLYIQACFEVAGGFGAVNKLIREKSVYMNNRVMDPMLALVKEQMAKNENRALAGIDKFNALGMKGLEWVDWAAVAPGWLAKYRMEVANVAKEQEAEYQKLLEKYRGSEWSDVLPDEESRANRALSEIMSSEQQDREAVARADDAVRRMQPSSRDTDIAPMFQSQNEIAKAVLQFQLALNRIWQNIRYDLPLAIKEKRIGTIAGMVTGYMAAGACLGFLLDDDDDDEKRERNWAAWILYNSLTQFTDAVPVIGESINYLADSLITGKPKYRGSRNILSVVDKAVDGLAGLAKAAREDDPEKSRKRAARAWQSVGEAVGVWFGAPVSGGKELGAALGIGDGDGEFEFNPEAFLGHRRKNK